MAKALNGVDISSYQKGIDLKSVPCDFVIIKLTQGTKYVNPDAKRAYEQAKAAGKLIGLYHYASSGGSNAEARHFVDNAKKLGAIGEAILILDWEKGDNANWGNIPYAKAFLDYVSAKCGVAPFIYMSKSVCRAYNWTSVAELYPLWVAQYKNYIQTGYQTAPWTDIYSYGAWSAPLIFQYSSNGKLSGYNGPLDLDIAYLTKAQWKKFAGAGETSDTPKSEKSEKTVDTTNYMLVKKGMKNEWVRLLQQALTVRGYSVAADGIFGEKTEAAVKCFQKDYGLFVDGIVGKHTWKALFS